MKTRYLIVVILLISASRVAAQERYVRPVDEARLDPSFLKFRTKLIAAVERKDMKYVLAILDPKVRLSFGGHGGVSDFKMMWAGKNETEFWKEFRPVIRNGGTFFREAGKRKSLFYAPFTFESFPKDLDAFEHYVIFGSNVNLREVPNNNSKIVGKLSYNVVRAVEETYSGNQEGKSEWYNIKTLGGLSGYVKSEFVRSPIDYRAGFEKKSGRWKMVAFIAGD